MKTDDFIKKALECNVSLTSNFSQYYLNDKARRRTNPTTIGWNFRFAMAELTKFVDYRCGFNDEGCKRHRGPNNTLCCCGGCSPGYIRRLPNGREHLKIVARCFDDNISVKRSETIKDGSRGFWRAKKGCVLPRKYRGNVCLGHKCGRLSRKDTIFIEIIFHSIEQTHILLEELINAKCWEGNPDLDVRLHNFTNAIGGHHPYRYRCNQFVCYEFYILVLLEILNNCSTTLPRKELWKQAKFLIRKRKYKESEVKEAIEIVLSKKYEEGKGL